MPRTLTDHKRWVAAVVVIAVAAVGVTVWRTTRSSGTNTAAAATTSLVAASTSTLRQTVTTTGTITPATESDLSFAVSGTVTSVAATVGRKVTKGQVLATVGTTDLDAAVVSAQAALDAADTNYSSLVADSSTATQLAAGKAQIASATSTLTAAKKARSEAALTSPITGTVASVGLATGDVVGSSGGSGSSGSSGGGAGASSGSGTGTSTAASTSTSSTIVVISTSSWVVDATVGSADLASVKAGLQAEITPTDTTTKVFGVVKSVGIVASSSTSGSATFPVAITVTGSPTGLYSGGTADVVLVVKQLTDVLTVPTAAVHTVNGKTVVYQKKNGSQVNTPVTIGTVFGASSQILSGIKAGDEVVTTTFGPGAGVRGGTGTTRTRTGGTEGGGTGTGFGGGAGGYGGGAGGYGGGAGGFGGGGN